MKWLLLTLSLGNPQRFLGIQPFLGRWLEMWNPRSFCGISVSAIPTSLLHVGHSCRFPILCSVWNLMENEGFLGVRSFFREICPRLHFSAFPQVATFLKVWPLILLAPKWTFNYLPADPSLRSPSCGCIFPSDLQGFNCIHLWFFFLLSRTWHFFSASLC